MKEPEELWHAQDEGELEQIGTCVIHSAVLPEYRCKRCGEILDPSMYEQIAPRGYYWSRSDGDYVPAETEQ